MERSVDLPNRLAELLEHAVHASDPEVALHALSALRRELDAFERVQAWRALDTGSSYGAVARALGISRQAAHRRYRELAAATEPPAGAEEPARLRVAPEARAAVQLAGEEAAALGAVRMGSEHLLLGILRARDGVAAAALRAHGVTIENARAAVQPTLAGEEPPEERASQVTVYARRVFTEALRAAAAGPSHVIEVNDLLKAALDDPNGGACRTLEALAVDVEAVRRSL
jgi:transposase-like protein